MAIRVFRLNSDKECFRENFDVLLKHSLLVIT